MLHASDEVFFRRLASARPRVPAGFADAVLRSAAVGAAALPVLEARRVLWVRPFALAAFASLAVAAAVVAVTRPSAQSAVAVDVRPGAPPHRVEVAGDGSSSAEAPPMTLSPSREPAEGMSCPMPAPGASPVECAGISPAEAAQPRGCPECSAAPPARSERWVSLTSDDATPTFGPATARVTVIELIDFECKFCERALSSVHELAALYPDDVRVVEKSFPMTGHLHAQLAAEAALAAGEQGKYREMRDLLLANQSDLRRPALESYAGYLGLDLDRFRRALDEGRFAAQVRRDADEAEAAGVTGVPAFVINGRLILGARPLEDLKTIVDEELARGR